jgi:DtxR family transcriptional regulator, Mn-dependent transcriptional regulator
VTDLIDTTEMYLRTIFELEEEGIVPLRARIAERLGHSGPTVSQTVARMERAGLLHVSGDRHLELTSDGRTKATRVMRKHRLAERLLVDVIGLEWQYVHEEACRWEHVMSERVELRLLQLLDHPTESPYGNPIPGLAELGEPGEQTRFLGEGLAPLSRLATTEPRQVVVRRIGEPAQADPALLSALEAAGLRPGSSVVVRRDGARLMVARSTAAGVEEPGDGGGGGEVEVPAGITEHVFASLHPLLTAAGSDGSVTPRSSHHIDAPRT